MQLSFLCVWSMEHAEMKWMNWFPVLLPGSEDIQQRYRNLCAGWMESSEGCQLQLHPHRGTNSKLHAKRDLGSEDAGRMERCPTCILGRSLSSAGGGTKESVGQFIFPLCWSLQGCWLQCPASLLPWTPSSQLWGVHSLGRVWCCNEVTVFVFKECFIHYILEMYRKWSKN